MEACGPIAKLLSKQEAVKQILPIVQRLSEVGLLPAKPLSRRGHSCGRAGMVTSMAARRPARRRAPMT